MSFDELFDKSDLPKIISQAKTLSKEECRAIYNYMERYRPVTILEFGTQFGCSTAIFLKIAKWLNIDLKLHSWDINDRVKCVDKKSFVFHKEDITSKASTILEFKPDLIFLDAHPYELTKNIIRICLDNNINFMCHDVSKNIYERAKLRSNNFSNYSNSTGTEWELYLLGQMISKDLLVKDYYEDKKLVVNCIRDKYGLAIIKNKCLDAVFCSKMNKLNNNVVYTAIFGGKDKLQKQEFIPNGWDFVCFSDKDFETDVWQNIKIDGLNSYNDIQKSRVFKMFPHIYLKRYDYSMWIDGNVVIYEDIGRIIKKYLDDNVNMATYKHGRMSIYEEANYLISKNKYGPEIISKQMDKYKKEKYPDKLGLSACHVLLRKHHDLKVIKCMNVWWNEFLNYNTGRDQLSFDYAKWVTNLNVNYFDGEHLRYSRNTRLFKMIKHLR